MLTRDNTKHLVAIVTACAGLATAIKSCTDSQAQAELVATRKVYSVVAARIAKQDEQIQKMHEDDLALRAYIDGFKEAVQRTEVTHRIEASLPPARAPRPAARAAPPPAAAAPPRRPPHVPAPTAFDGNGAPDGVQVLPPPPAPQAAPSFDQLPAFDALQ